jgi:hypothetical protein
MAAFHAMTGECSTRLSIVWPLLLEQKADQNDQNVRTGISHTVGFEGDRRFSGCQDLELFVQEGDWSPKESVLSLALSEQNLDLRFAYFRYCNRTCKNRLKDSPGFDCFAIVCPNFGFLDLATSTVNRRALQFESDSVLPSVHRTTEGSSSKA